MKFSYKNIKKPTPSWAVKLGGAFIACATALVGYGFSDGFDWAKKTGIILMLLGTFLMTFFKKD